ncbi:MAG: SEC-C metal-binding domain-containing protein, partial [Desulfovibrionaceae bacterium]|nr:SEC-C metal-binding domain-containing protein [Desulfovibrionaceae bacterium]
EHPLISRSIMNAQKRVEAHNFEIRKTLLDYDNVMNQQRRVIYALRREAIDKASLEDTTREFIEDVLAEELVPLLENRKEMEKEELEAARGRLEDVFHLSRAWPEGPPPGLPEVEDVRRGMLGYLDELKSQAPEKLYENILAYFILGELDRCWCEHLLAMDQLRDGIGLRGYGQRDPKQEYKREGFAMFQEMLQQIKTSVCRSLAWAVVQGPGEEVPAGPVPLAQPAAPSVLPVMPASEDEQLEQAWKLGFKHKENKALSYSDGSASAKPATVKRDDPKVGRNDPCPCGSGKKYKKCCGMKV